MQVYSNCMYLYSFISDLVSWALETKLVQNIIAYYRVFVAVKIFFVLIALTRHLHVP